LEGSRGALSDGTIHWKALEEHFLMAPFIGKLLRSTFWKALEEHFLMAPFIGRL
jgi:hypothetical protein